MKNLPPCCVQPLQGVHTVWLVTQSSNSQTSEEGWSSHPHSHSSSLYFTFSLPLKKTLWISWVQPQTQGVVPFPVAFMPLCHISWHRPPGGTWTPLEGCCSACYRDCCGKGFRQGQHNQRQAKLHLEIRNSHWNADSNLLGSRWSWRLYLPWSCQKVLIYGLQQNRKMLETEGGAE